MGYADRAPKHSGDVEHHRVPRSVPILGSTDRHLAAVLASARQVLMASGLVLLRHIIGVGGFARCVAAWTSREGACEGGGQVSSHRCDRVWHMPFGTDWRRIGACNFRERQVPGI